MLAARRLALVAFLLAACAAPASEDVLAEALTRDNIVIEDLADPPGGVVGFVADDRYVYFATNTASGGEVYRRPLSAETAAVRIWTGAAILGLTGDRESLQLAVEHGVAGSSLVAIPKHLGEPREIVRSDALRLSELAAAVDADVILARTPGSEALLTVPKSGGDLRPTGITIRPSDPDERPWKTDGAYLYFLEIGRVVVHPMRDVRPETRTVAFDPWVETEFRIGPTFGRAWAGDYGFLSPGKHMIAYASRQNQIITLQSKEGRLAWHELIGLPSLFPDEPVSNANTHCFAPMGGVNVWCIQPGRRYPIQAEPPGFPERWRKEDVRLVGERVLWLERSGPDSSSHGRLRSRVLRRWPG